MLENMNSMLEKAKEQHYAIPQFNINNCEWAKYILQECNSLNVPVILGVSEGAIKYIGGYNTVTLMIKGLIKDLNINIPVCIHLDHGTTIESCKQAIDSGFTSVMIDASKYSLEKNIEITKEVVEYAKDKNISVEAEVGYIGVDDENSTTGIPNAKVEDCLVLYDKTKVNALAPAIGNAHGLYTQKPNLDFKTLKIINDTIAIPLVLHGGTGIPEEQLKEAIACGINKININTDLQVAWNKSIREYIEKEKEIYDPRKIISSGETAIKERIKEIVTLFGTRI